MKYLSNKNGFLGIDNKFSFKEKAVIVPFGLEKTVSYGGGTKNGPKEIIKASHQVELYDEELNCEPYKKIGIKTLKPFKIDKNIKKALNKISNINKEILDKKLFPMTLGGEHSITPGCIVPFNKKYKNICLLHFDAHADLRQSYNGEKFSHASAIRRCLDYKNVSLISFGIRNISESEISFLKKNSSRINIFWAKDKKKWNLSKFKKLIKTKSLKFEQVSSQKKSAFIVLNEITILIPLEGIVDTEKEKSKLNDKKNIYSKKLKVVLDKLNNKAFIDKAPDNVIENFKIQEKEINSSIEKIDEIINTIN